MKNVLIHRLGIRKVVLRQINLHPLRGMRQRLPQGSVVVSEIKEQDCVFYTASNRMPFFLACGQNKAMQVAVELVFKMFYNEDRFYRKSSQENAKKHGL